jgi:2-iminoacetate synthase ThiH
MAGSKEENPVMTTEEISNMIREAGFIPVERDSLYNPILPPIPPLGGLNT